jgi:hypothetical protein
MKPKKNSRRCQASVSIQALDLAISRFIHSLARHTANKGPVRIQYKCLVPISYNVLSPSSYTLMYL